MVDQLATMQLYNNVTMYHYATIFNYAVSHHLLEYFLLLVQSDGRLKARNHDAAYALCTLAVYSAVFSQYSANLDS